MMRASNSVPISRSIRAAVLHYAQEFRRHQGLHARRRCVNLYTRRHARRFHIRPSAWRWSRARNPCSSKRVERLVRTDSGLDVPGGGGQSLFAALHDRERGLPRRETIPEYIFSVIRSRSASYFKADLAPVSIWVSENYSAP